MIEYVNQYGDQAELDVNLDCEKLLEEIKLFDGKWSQYNELKPWIKRQGLCVINERGKVGPGPALNSIYEWNKKNGTSYTELDFDKPTELYYASSQVQRILKDILPYCVRTHFLKLPRGGFFPEHRDHRGRNQKTFRLIVPIQECNPGAVRFMIEDRTLYWRCGKMYYINTTKPHTIFNASTNQDSIWLVINAKLCNEMIDFVSDKLKCK